MISEESQKPGGGGKPERAQALEGLALNGQV